ncbi:MAG: hypothetical protein IKQ80_13585 [Clostridia bacterium]|nr:hypothetical protein [Clostridia bacterium]
MRKLLILSALFTGHGHKSVADALEERLAVYDDIEVKTIDGFSLMNRVEQYMAEYTYGPITRMPGKAWEWNYAAGKALLKPLTRLVASVIKARLLALLYEFRPDAILTVHPIFVGTVLDVLQEAGLNIPFYAHEVDLVDIAEFWFDPRIDLTFAPSREAYDYTIAHGVDPEKVIQVGFPVRKRFMDVPRPAPHEGTVITVMSGSEGSGIMRTVTRILLRHTDAHVNVICGRNKKLRKKLREGFAKKYHGRLNAMGFVEDVQNVMAGSDVLIMRASPNAAMEAVVLNVPLILFGQLAGQEQHNPDLLEAHGVAKYCPTPEDLPACLDALFADDRAQIRQMRAAQRAYVPTDVAAETAKLLNDIIKPLDR